MKDGTRGLERVDTALQSVTEPISDFEDAVVSVLENVRSALFFFRGLIEFVTTSSFCFFFKGQVELYEQMKDLARIVLRVINTAFSYVKALTASLNTLDQFQELMNSGVFKVFRKFSRILDVFDPLVDNLSFVEDLANFDMCIRVPQFRRCDQEVCVPFIGCATIPWYCAGWKTSCFGLPAIGDVLRKIENAIKSIPMYVLIWRYDNLCLCSIPLTFSKCRRCFPFG